MFLWVFFVTNLLRRGLINRDSFSDMRWRLESFPPELKDFFRKILTSVDPFYHKKMATTLRFAITANEPLQWELYAFHEQEHDNENYIFQLPMQSSFGTCSSKEPAR